jgi:hypothetical protein
MEITMSESTTKDISIDISNTVINLNDYKVADLSLADFGRKEIELAEA